MARIATEVNNFNRQNSISTRGSYATAPPSIGNAIVMEREIQINRRGATQKNAVDLFNQP